MMKESKKSFMRFVEENILELGLRTQFSCLFIQVSKK